MRRICIGVLCTCTAICVGAAQESQRQVSAAASGFGSNLFPQDPTGSDPTMSPPDLSLVPQEYSVDDGPVSIKLPFKLFVNGEEWRGHSIGWSLLAGSTMWLALPGKGRYILSLTPRIGYEFSASGAVRDHAIMFTSGGDEYEIRTSAPIAGLGKSWNLYVLHQPAREPKGPLFGVGRLEDLMRWR